MDNVGSSWVEAGRYEISTDAGATLNTQNWSDNIRPGMTLSMSMILHEREFAGSIQANTCPSCLTPYKGVRKRDLELVRW